MNYLDAETKAKVFIWLKKKWPEENRKCEICDSKNWILADDVIMPLIFAGWSLVLGENSYPHILIVCNWCGNSKAFNAVIMGIITQDTIETEVEIPNKNYNYGIFKRIKKWIGYDK